MTEKNVDVGTTEPTVEDRIGRDITKVYGGFFDPNAPIPMPQTARWRIRLAAIASLPSWFIGAFVLGILIEGQLPDRGENLPGMVISAPLVLQILVGLIVLILPFAAIFSLFIQKIWTVWLFCGCAAVVCFFRFALIFLGPPAQFVEIFSLLIYVLWSIVFGFAVFHALRSQAYLDKLAAEADPEPKTDEWGRPIG